MALLELYLDLLKKTLTNTLVQREPSDDQNATFVLDFYNHYICGPAISMLPIVRMDNIQECLADIVAKRVPGDVIETGVWRGGATIFMRGMLKAMNVQDRLVWVADSFEGLPVPDETRYPLEAQAHRGVVMREKFNHFAVGLEEVQANFQAFGLLDDRVRFLKGWFKDTLPGAPIERLSLMRLDGDYYESTMDALNSLYDRLSIGGYVIVDDYGEDEWTYCRQAVDEFRATRSIEDPIIMVDQRCCYWQRSR